MEYMVVSTDDLSLASLPLLKYWDEIKTNHPNFKLEAFVTPFWWGIKEYNIYENKEFRTEIRKREWITCSLHGYTHEKRPECQRFSTRQYRIIKRGLMKLFSFLDKECYGFKAPYYRISKYTPEVLQKLGFTYMVYWNQLILFKELKKPIPKFMIIPTHTNMHEKNPDDISIVYKELNEKLFELERQGYVYTTFHDIVKTCLN